MNEPLIESAARHAEPARPEEDASTPVEQLTQSADKAGRSTLPLVASVLFMLLTFAVGLGLGFSIGLRRAPNDAGRFAVSSVKPELGQAAESSSSSGTASALNQHFDVFWEAMDLLYRDFYGEIPSSEQMTFGAIRGAIESAGRPEHLVFDTRRGRLFSQQY